MRLWGHIESSETFFFFVWEIFDKFKWRNVQQSWTRVQLKLLNKKLQFKIQDSWLTEKERERKLAAAVT